MAQHEGDPAFRRAYRLAAARSEAPRVLIGVAVILALAEANSLLVHGWTVGHGARTAALAGVVIAWWVVRRGLVPDRLVPQVVALVSVAYVGAVAVEASDIETVLPLVSVIIGLLVYCPFVLSLPVALVAAIPMLAGYAIAVLEVDPSHVSRWLVQGLTALVLGMLVLVVRLRNIDQAAVLAERLHAQATRDPLTGLLNRNGLDELVPRHVAAARRRDETVFALFVDVDGLKAANDQFGHEFGDEILVAVADALESTTRTDDLVARWGGDEFVVVGTGQPTAADEVEQRMAAALSARTDLATWSRTVSAGLASAHAEVDVADLLHRSDADMYRRRGIRRGA